MEVDLDALCRGSVPFPDNGVHVHIKPADAVVGNTSCDDPQLVNIITSPLTVLNNGISFWIVAYLSASGYALILGGRLPYICMTSATLPHLIEGLLIPLGLRE